jgi:hypothetical protein
MSQIRNSKNIQLWKKWELKKTFKHLWKYDSILATQKPLVIIFLQILK